MSLLTLTDICVTYGKGENAVHALKDINLCVNTGDFVAVTGKSGCGKSTLLNVLGGICKPCKGKYIFNDKCISGLSVSRLADFRSKDIGFVVQHFALIKDMTVSQNIALPLKYRRYPRPKIESRVLKLIKEFDLKEKEDKFPPELSGGQCQRVAIARAIAGKPTLLLADEPTGALDEETGYKIMDIIKGLNDNGTTIIMVTHDPSIAQYAKSKVLMKDGRIL